MTSNHKSPWVRRSKGGIKLHHIPFPQKIAKYKLQQLIWMQNLCKIGSIIESNHGISLQKNEEHFIIDIFIPKKNDERPSEWAFHKYTVLFYCQLFPLLEKVLFRSKVPRDTRVLFHVKVDAPFGLDIEDECSYGISHLSIISNTETSISKLDSLNLPSSISSMQIKALQWSEDLEKMSLS